MQPDASISGEVRAARKLFAEYGPAMLADPRLAVLLAEYHRQIEKTHEMFTEAGVFIQCAACAGCDQISCCFLGVENWFGRMLMLINLLMGVALCEQREVADQCLFLGPMGCKIVARFAICINFFCPALKAHLGAETLGALRKQGGDEVWAGVELENALTVWIAQHPRP